MSTNLATAYRDFYAGQGQEARRIRSWLKGVPAAYVVLTLGLLIALQSHPMVWAYVGILLIVTIKGLRRLEIAAAVTEAANDHFRQVADRLVENPGVGRDELLTELRGKIDPTDLSNVPEALVSLASSGKAEGVPATANSAYARSAVELSTASVVRTILVLGGLFGTVLFFALQLTGSEIQAGDLRNLLQGLRGALVSTLAGILGSLVLGYLMSRLDRIVDEAIWESEAFLYGPVTAVLLARSVGEPDTELELWEALRAEVARLVDKTSLQQSKLADDIAAHAQHLGVLSDTIQNLPPVKIPPQLARLEDVVAEFSRGTQALQATASPMLDAVASLGVFAPAKMLADIDSLKGQSADQHKDSNAQLARGFERVGDLLRGIETLVRGLQATCDRIPSDFDSRLAAVATDAHTARAEIAQVGDRLNESQKEIGRRLQELAIAAEASTAPAGQLEALPEHQEALHIAGSRLATLLTRLEATADVLERMREPQRQDSALTQIDEGTNLRAEPTCDAPEDDHPPREDAVLLRQLEESVRVQLGEVHEALAELTRRVGELSGLAARLDRLDVVVRWHDQATRAPLMRFLMRPFRRNGRATDASSS